MKSGITGLIIAAAFIGPGTVTTASIAGASMGYALVWALVFSIIATCVLQEMASRLGLVSGKGLSEAITQTLTQAIPKWIGIILVVSAIGIGNAAYEGGNLTGAAMGLANVLPGTIRHWSLGLGAIAFVILLRSNYAIVEKILVSLVAVMSLVFIAIMFIAGIDVNAFADGIQQLGFSNTTLLLAIIGTTIVPYNLFLHAGLSASQSKASPLGDFDAELPKHRRQLFTSIGIGGIVTFAIMSSAASAFYLSDTVLSTNNIASQLEPVLGEYANIFFAIGLFSAGITSAITAPLAAGYAICGLFGWHCDLTHRAFKTVSITILVVGVLVASLGLQPLVIIVIAQASNAVLLPISAAFLLFVMNQKSIMGEQTNKSTSNALTVIILLVVLALAASKIHALLS
ncbi:Nramp family divalent metal transporter [Glaciecola sp. MH2013]|uniref:Nramp family divalent metal transporter n=1 Tax=Glaciecola sp. MH2013 TaxID=2785524 RepID=UPI00189D0B49|nr:Nramp family divalent metal transporter [Glaciecola sp. MH2013]MBF7073808.1 Nramp family divalent metal transporter [Glaciecola sp. MH2013]